jgi:hypothetical protein
MKSTPSMPFGYISSESKSSILGLSQSDDEKSRNVSIQSLITTPGVENSFEPTGGERGMKRKGGDGQDEDDQMARSSRGGSVISTTGLSMEDPDVREAVEALGGLKAGKYHLNGRLVR